MCTNLYLKSGRVQSKIYVGSTFEKDIKELDLRKAYLYLGIEEGHDMEQKNEKERLKKEYVGRQIGFGHGIKCKE